jgi:bifunctional enzyme CysN/CysC
MPDISWVAPSNLWAEENVVSLWTLPSMSRYGNTSKRNVKDVKEKFYMPHKIGTVQSQSPSIHKKSRAERKQQVPLCIWLTGLSGAGKSTLGNLLEERLHAAGHHTYLLDGDHMRHGICSDLDFSMADRRENVRRIAEIAKLMVDAGLIVIVATISPERVCRAAARALFEEGEFLEVFVDAGLDVCERRDPKGLYARARRGEINNFTGIDSLYEAPVNAQFRVDTVADTVESCVEQVARIIHDHIDVVR